jgi:hypothetical protein
MRNFPLDSTNHKGWGRIFLIEFLLFGVIGFGTGAVWLQLGAGVFFMLFIALLFFKEGKYL